MWSGSILKRVLLLTLLISICGFSRTLHIFNPWDNTALESASHPKIKLWTGAGVESVTLPIADQTNCGWYSYSFTESQLSILFTNTAGTEVGTPGLAGNKIYLDTLGRGLVAVGANLPEDIYISYETGTHVITATQQALSGTCIGIISAQVFDWTKSSFDGKNFEPPLVGAGGEPCDGELSPYTGLVQPDLVNGVPVRSSITNKCNTSGLNDWFQPASGNNSCTELALARSGSNYTITDNSYFPINNFAHANNDKTNANNLPNNFYFCMTFNADFIYNQGTSQIFSFTGDDDVWVFIDGHLEIDIGGYHQKETKSANMDVVLAGSADGSEHTLDFFFCERKQTESNLSITTDIDFKQDEVYSNKPVVGVPNTWEIVDGVEYQQGCGGVKTEITRNSKFWITRGAPDLDSLISGGGTLADGLASGLYFSGIVIDKANHRFTLNSNLIKGDNLPPGDYYLVHQTTEAGRTDQGSVHFSIYPQITFTNGGGVSQALEGANGGWVQIPFSLNYPAKQDLQFDYVISGTATNVDDYTIMTAPVGSVVIKNGQTNGELLIRIVQDDIQEADETIILTLTSPSNVVLGSITQLRHTILNDDFGVSVQNHLFPLNMVEDGPDQNGTFPLAAVFDANGNTLTYTAAIVSGGSNAVTAAITGSAGSEEVTVSTVLNQNGNDQVVVTATTAGGVSVADTFAVTVTPVNDLPTIRPDAGGTIRLTIRADETHLVQPQRIFIEDIETAPGALVVTPIYSGDLTALPMANITINNVAGIDNKRDIVLTPVTTSAAGEFRVSFEVVDLDGGKDTLNIYLDITGEFRIESYIGTDKTEDVAFTILNTDLDYINLPGGYANTAVVLTFPTPSAGADYTVDASGTIYPTADFNGYLSVTVQATVNGKTDTKAVEVNVLNSNDLPYNIVLSPNNYHETNYPVCHTLSASDNDGDAITFSINVSETRFEIQDGNKLCSKAGSFDYEAAQSGTVTVTANDGTGDFAQALNFTVTDDTSEKTTGAIESITNVSEVIFIRDIFKDSAYVITNTNSITVEYSVEGVAGTQQATINLTKLDTVQDYYIYPYNPTTNSPDTLTISVSQSTVAPTIKITRANFTSPDTLEDGSVTGWLFDFTEPVIVGTAILNDGTSIDTVYTNKGDLVLTKTIEMINEFGELEAQKLSISLDEEGTLTAGGTVNSVSDSVTDSYGNQATYEFYVIYDVETPSVVIHGPADGLVTSRQKQDVNWSFSDAVDGSGVINDDETLIVGSFGIIRQFRDRAGNLGADTVVILVEREELEQSVDLKEAVVSYTPEELVNLNGNVDYPAGVYIEREESGIRTVEIVYGDHVNGGRPLEKDSTPIYQVEVQDELAYDEKAGVEVVISMTFPRPYEMEDSVYVTHDPYTGDPIPPLWINEVKGEIHMYDILGQYLSTYTWNVNVDDVAYYDKAGKVVMRFMMFMQGEGEDKALRTKNGRLLGSGIYILASNVKQISTASGANSGAASKTIVQSDVMRAGYFRPQDK